MAVGGGGSDGLVEGVGAFIADGGGAGGSPTPLSPEFDDVLALLCALEGLGGVFDPDTKGEESRPDDGIPKKEDAANDGIADGGFSAGNEAEPPRKPPLEVSACKSSTSQLFKSTSATGGAA